MLDTASRHLKKLTPIIDMNRKITDAFIQEMLYLTVIQTAEKLSNFGKKI
jgi:transketolase N-terminal domain/subunit